MLPFKTKAQHWAWIEIGFSAVALQNKSSRSSMNWDLMCRVMAHLVYLKEIAMFRWRSHKKVISVKTILWAWQIRLENQWELTWGSAWWRCSAPRPPRGPGSPRLYCSPATQRGRPSRSHPQGHPRSNWFQHCFTPTCTMLGSRAQ